MKVTLCVPNRPFYPWQVYVMDEFGKEIGFIQSVKWDGGNIDINNHTPIVIPTEFNNEPATLVILEHEEISRDSMLVGRLILDETSEPKTKIVNCTLDVRYDNLDARYQKVTGASRD
jgi:hypothetical protein